MSGHCPVPSPSPLRRYRTAQLPHWIPIRTHTWIMERDKSNETLEPPGEPYLDSPRHLDEYDEGVFDEDIQLADWQDGHFGHPDSTYQMQTHMHGEPPGEVIDESMRYSPTISPPPPPFLPIQDAGNEPPIDSPQGSALDEAIQYAYENSLASDYLLQSFSLSHLFGPLAQGTIPLTNEDGFTDHSELRVLCVPESILTDKMQVTTSSFKLIAKARYIPSEEELQDATNQVCSPAKVEASKLELPILRTDNDRDLRTFQKDLLQLTSANALLESIKKHRLPLHPQNLAEGEGMELSSEAHAESEAMMKKAEGEKLTVTKASIEYLVSQLKDDYTIEDKTAHMIEETTCEKASILWPTPVYTILWRVSDRIHDRHGSRRRSHRQLARSLSTPTPCLCSLHSTPATSRSCQTTRARCSVTISTP